MRRKISRMYVIGFGCILWGMCNHFVFFQSNAANPLHDREGIFVDAFLLLGGKSAFFLCLFLLAWLIGSLQKHKGWKLLRLGFLLGLFALLFYWMNDMRQALQYASTNDMSLQLGSGYIIVCLGFALMLVRELFEFRRF